MLRRIHFGGACKRTKLQREAYIPHGVSNAMDEDENVVSAL